MSRSLGGLSPKSHPIYGLFPPVCRLDKITITSLPFLCPGVLVGRFPSPIFTLRSPTSLLGLPCTMWGAEVRGKAGVARPPHSRNRLRASGSAPGSPPLQLGPSPPQVLASCSDGVAGYQVTDFKQILVRTVHFSPPQPQRWTGWGNIMPGCLWPLNCVTSGPHGPVRVQRSCGQTVT